jgi:hypothetical protein
MWSMKFLQNRDQYECRIQERRRRTVVERPSAMSVDGRKTTSRTGTPSVRKPRCCFNLETRVLSDPSVLELHRAFSSLCIIGIARGWGGETAEVSRCHPSLDGGHMRKGRGESVRSDCGATASRRRRYGDEKEHNNLARVLWFFAPRCVRANADADIGAFTKRQVPVKAAPNGGHLLGPGQLGTRAE